MALCKACHKEIDDHPEWFSRHDLRAMKDEHERRVDAALEELRDNGTLGEISQKWFDTDITTP